MKSFTCLILFVFSIQIITAQTIDFKELKLHNITNSASKTEIFDELGKPLQSYNPDYECGYLSSEEQMESFETLEYKHVKFTGNDSDGYIIDTVNFLNGSTPLFYATFQLNAETTLEDLREIFGGELLNDLNKNSEMLIIPNKDKNKEDGFLFQLKNGKLISITFWSPC
jgi:hypothetical protein